MQNWKKLGLLYEGENYAAVPIAYHLDDDNFRIFFTSRDSKNQSSPNYIDINIITQNIVSKASKIDVPLGEIGTFDENGVMLNCYLLTNNKMYFYYQGWNVGSSVPFRNSIGLLVSDSDISNFQKVFEGPILDRSIYDKCFVATPCVIEDDNCYRMYYLSCDKWEYIDNTLTHSYNIKYAESKDGIHWQRNGKVIIDFCYENEYAISVPRVIKDNNSYKMWFSYRGGEKANTYRIGYAESDNAIDWVRKDEEVNLDVTHSQWDSQMLCYPFVFDHKGKRYMLYNGNGYGKSGFGLAVLE